jgi:hypothetical protein
MSAHLNQYLILLLIRGIQRESNPNALEQITNEIAMRTHLKCNNIVQKEDTNEIMVEVMAWGLTKETVAKQVAEEIFEITCAVLEQPEGVSVHIQNT